LEAVFCDSLTHSSQALAYLVEVMGADRVVIGTDAPFDVEDPQPLDSLAAAPRLSEEDRVKIRSISPLAWLYGPLSGPVLDRDGSPIGGPASTMPE
jgi:aminocarboxymuconate-semialdehyde decarboxylase